MNGHSNFILRLAVMACFFLFSGCGLDVYYVLNAPGVNNCPLETSNVTSYESRYFSFKPDETVDSSDFSFDGTEVYYKIYRSSSVCIDEYSTLNNLTNSESTKANSASSLVSTYKFQRLKRYGNDSSPFVPEGYSGKTIWIRLTTYNDSTRPENVLDPTTSNFTASVYFDGTYQGTPVRYYGNRGFDFARGSDATTGINNDLPLTSDYEDDVSSSTAVSGTNVWYITLYAFGTGHDSSFTTYNSPITHLGTIIINADSKDN